MSHEHDEGGALQGFSRPRYFYGQLLDVRHFESEQSYFKRKLWMLNRMVSGFGVVCGLDVQVGSGDYTVVVTEGLGLDKHGREIVVPCQSKPIAIEPMPYKPPEETYKGEGKEGKAAPRHQQRPEEDYGDEEWVHLVICYKEAKADPEPVLSGGCESDDDRCSPGSIREGYELKLLPGRAPEIAVDCGIPNLVKGNNLNYRALAEWVSAPCDAHTDPCLTLANIRRPATGGTIELSDIDISVRPIVYSLDLLWEVLLALTHETHGRRTGKN